MSYDKNGNILSLQRFGKVGSSYALMYNLTYGYIGNRLTQVTDAISGNNEVDFVPHGAGNYTYYTDGSLKSDANEQISNIIYDTYHKQPIEVVLSDGRKINHYYDGGGTLLKTAYSTGEKWEFYGDFILKNNQIYQVNNDEVSQTVRAVGSKNTTTKTIWAIQGSLSEILWQFLSMAFICLRW